jgi:hypothetical protein
MKLSIFVLAILLLSSCSEKVATLNKPEEKQESLVGKWELMYYTVYMMDNDGTLTELKDDGKLVTGSITNKQTNKTEKVNRPSPGLIAMELKKNKSFTYRTPLENGEYKIDEGIWENVSKSPKFKSGNKILFGTKLKKFTHYNKEGIAIDSADGVFDGINVYEVLSNNGKQLEYKVFYKTGIEGKDYPKIILTFRKL